MTQASISAETLRYISRHFDTANDDGKNYAGYFLRTLESLNWQGDITLLRDALPYGTRRLGFTEFLNTMSHLGYAPKIVKIRQDKIKEDILPCLFVLEGDENKTKGQMLFEPPSGHKSGTAYVFMENHDAVDIIPDKTISASNLKWFSKLILRFRSIFWQVVVASLVINILALVTPLFMMSVYDKVIGAHSPATLKYLLSGVILAIGVEFSLRFLRARSLAWFGARVDQIVSNAILERLLALPASYIERASVAAQLTRLKAFESVREFFTGPLFLSFVEFPFTIILVVAIWMIAGNLAVIPLIIAALYGVLLVVMRSRLKALTARMASANTERQTMNIETLGKQETLRYAGGFDAWLDRYEKASAEASYAGYCYSRAITVIDTLSQGLVILGGIAMIYFGIHQIWAGAMSMGGMIAILILTWRTLAPLQTACTAIPRLDQVKNNIEQINRLMELTPEREPYMAAQDTPRFVGDVEFKNVGLRYTKDSDPVYAGLSFTAKKGQLVAIVGGNSTGKSTTLKLVSGLYSPQAGSLRIDGTDIRQIDPLKLRQNIAYVGQEPAFFTGTLEENLRLVKPEASYEEIGTAIKKAGLDDWLRTLPDALDTMLGARSGVSVPSSLLPQLALARAYLQNSAIMLFDEMPYEFLNSDDGESFLKFLREQKGQRTIFYVTYRQDYIDLADIVVHLHQDGRPQVKEK